MHRNAPAGSTRVTIAQIAVTTSVRDNLSQIQSAFEQASRDQAGWILLPEGALSGYHGDFDQSRVESAFAKLQGLCASNAIVGLIGTCWKEDDGRAYNQIRIVDRTGALAGSYSKTCLTYSDTRQFGVGTRTPIHTVGGFDIGTLICNDMWVTPGFSDGPNPHSSLKIARSGAQVLFHAVNSGSDPRFRQYHESNLSVRSGEAEIPFVVANAASTGETNCTSGVVYDFDYVKALPRAGEAVETVDISPFLGKAEERSSRGAVQGDAAVGP